MKFSVLTFLLSIAALALHGENWPRFRGPTGQGISTEKNLPLHWNTTSNIAWKTAVPRDGWSSPIVFDDRVFLTTATDNGTSCRVLCLNRKDGKFLWNKEVFQQVPRRKEGKNSYATPTPVTDGKHVYAVFGDGSIAALTVLGKVEWTNRDTKFYSQHGLGASPILYEDLLIMPFDGSSEGDDKKVGWQKPWEESYITALDKNTGKEKWRARRGPSRIAHVTPLIHTVEGKPQLISGAGDVVQGFNLQTGERLWSVRAQGEGVVPSPVIGNDVIFASSGFEKSVFRAIKPGGKGDVTRSNILWEQIKGVPTQSSPIHVTPHVYAVTDGGIATCYKEATGEIVWQDRVGRNFSASPIVSEGKIYFLNEEGETTVIKAGDKLEVLAKNPLGEKCQASFAVSQGQLFIRTENHLYCIGGGGAKR